MGAPLGTNPSHPARRTDIQGLRGIAVLLVVLFHARLPVAGGFVGVDVFFVISGFVIASSLLREAEVGGRFSLVQFYARRLRRLLPAASVLIAVTAVLTALLSSPVEGQSEALGTGLAATFWLANLQRYVKGQGYFDASEEINPFLHMWSLSVEEQFYLVLPVLLFATLWVARRRSWSVRAAIGTAVGATVAVSFAVSVISTAGAGPIPQPERFAFFMLPSRWWEMGAGVLLALVAPRVAAARLPAAAGNAIGFGALVALLAVAAAYSAETAFPGLAAVPPVAAAAVLIAIGPVAPALRTLLSVRPLAWVGDLSYSWYLWHWPLIVFADLLFPETPVALVAAAVLSLGPAAASYRWVESRYLLRNPGPIRIGPTLRVAAASMATVAALTAALWVTVDQRSSAPDELAGRTWARSAGCHRSDYQDETWPRDRCLVDSPESDRLALLIGDSYALSLSEAARTAATEAGVDLAVWTMTRCPAIARDMVAYPGCTRFHGAVRDLIAELEPDVVIVTNRSPAYVCGPDAVCDAGVLPEGEGTAHERALAGWALGLDDLAADVTAAGAELVLIGTGPRFPFSPAATVSTLRPDGVRATIPVTEAEEQLAPTEAIERQVADTHGATFVDMVDVMCDDTTCRSHDDDVWMVYDVGHPTVPATMRLTPTLRGLFEAG